MALDEAVAMLLTTTPLPRQPSECEALFTKFVQDNINKHK